MKIKTDRSTYTLIKRLGIVVNEEIETEFQSLYPGDEIDEETLIETLRKEISDHDIEEQISSVRSIVLNVSEGCNYRCKYCAYSGIYKSTRVHSTEKMSRATAEKAVNFFLNLFANHKRKVKDQTILICFYGGEALLEFALIKDTVQYARKKLIETGLANTFKLKFRVTTNGYLLKQAEIREFLVENDFFIDISLDGPKQEHDKFRVTYDGKETWDVIWNNIKTIHSEHPDFYSRNVSYLTTLHPHHNTEEIDKFFRGNRELFDPDHVTINMVNSGLLKEEIKKEWFGKKPSQNSEIMSEQANERFAKRITLRKIDSNTRFTGMCSPQDVKPFINTDGKIYVCERVREIMPIGDVEYGLDIAAYKKLLRVWNEEIIKYKCWECDAWGFCNVCASQSEDPNEFKINCFYKRQFEDILRDFILAKEKEDQTKSASQSFPTDVKDYIRRLGDEPLNRDRLKPYVYKVEGAAGFVLYNILTGEFFNFSNEGTIEELRKNLLDEHLIFETDGIVPAKVMQIDMTNVQTSIFLKELQIRLNGRGEDTCWNRKKNNGPLVHMSDSTLKRLQEMCQHIPITKIRIEAETYNGKQIEWILRDFNVNSIELYIEEGITKQDGEALGAINNELKGKVINIVSNRNDARKDIKEQKIDIYNFFYTQYFNPCLGHQVAVDSNGDIKCCLWFPHTLGNIDTDDIREMIIKGSFDTYWGANKNKIETCKDCEIRFTCNDCRVESVQRKADFYAKPLYCEYDPYTGE